MTTPAYSHTYTYSRVGIGDVIALDPAGAPYTGSAVLPSGWEANYWYATDPLASVHDVAKWTQMNIAVIPANATQVLVNVTSAPRTANSGRLKVTIGSSNYKAATGLRYTDSGSHKTSFAAGNPSLPGSPMHYFDFTDVGTLWKDEAGTDPVTADGDVIARIDNKGSSSANLTNDVAGERPVYKVNIAGGQSIGRFDGVDDVLRNLSVAENRSAGDFMIAFNWVHRDNQALQASDVMWSWHNVEAWVRLEEGLNPGLGVQSVVGINAGGVPDSSVDVSAAGAVPIDTGIAVIAFDDGADAQEHFWSWISGTAVEAGTPSDGPDASQILAIGNQNDAGIRETEIDVLELAIWVHSTGPTVQDIKDYFSIKNAVAWA